MAVVKARVANAVAKLAVAEVLVAEAPLVEAVAVDPPPTPTLLAPLAQPNSCRPSGCPKVSGAAAVPVTSITTGAALARHATASLMSRPSYQQSSGKVRRTVLL